MSEDQRNGTLSDSDSDNGSISSMSTDEIESHFETRYGRRFHSHGTVPYPLPADPFEMQRLNRLHEAIKLYFGGSNYSDTVAAILHGSPDASMTIVDLGTGSGIWVDEMATEFPNFHFYGVDIVPTARRDPDPNVQYEVGELERTGFHRGFCEFVHMRQTSLGVTNFGQVVDEVRRILQPGGYFYFAEWIRNVYMVDGSIVGQHAPRAAEFFSVINGIMLQKGVAPNPNGLASNLHHGQQFELIQTVPYNVVLSNPDVIGCHFRNAFKEYADALIYLLMDSGYTEGEAEQLVTDFKHDVDVVPGLTVVYCTILARKL